MDLNKLGPVLQVAGAIALATPPLLAALIAFFVVVPGEQPEKFLQSLADKVQKLVDLIGSVSKKKPDAPNS